MNALACIVNALACIVYALACIVYALACIVYASQCNANAFPWNVKSSPVLKTYVFTQNCTKSLNIKQLTTITQLPRAKPLPKLAILNIANRSICE